MNTDPGSPYTLRPRCTVCHGRRLIAVDHVDFIELVPCPLCNGDKPRPATMTAPVKTLARAA